MKNSIGHEKLKELGVQAQWNKGTTCEAVSLLPAVIQSHRSGEVLMLGYMSFESFERSVELGKVVFYSRSKKRLWCKGETSGHFFEIVGIALDCDKDTFLFSVREQGPACHRNVRTCFSGDDNSDFKGILPQASVVARVFETIQERAKGNDPSSYSFKMLQGNLDRILKKLGEETSETIVAAKNFDFFANQKSAEQRETLRNEFAGEAADLIFHLLLCCAKLGIDLENISEILAARQGAVRRDGTTHLPSN